MNLNPDPNRDIIVPEVLDEEGSDLKESGTDGSHSLTVHDVLECFRFMHPSDVAALIKKMEPQATRETFEEALVEKIMEDWTGEGMVRHYQDSLKALAMLGRISELRSIAEEREVSASCIVTALSEAEPDDKAAAEWLPDFVGDQSGKIHFELTRALEKFQMIDQLFELGDSPNKWLSDDAIHAIGRIVSPRKQEIAEYLRLKEQQTRILWTNTANRLKEAADPSLIEQEGDNVAEHGMFSGEDMYGDLNSMEMMGRKYGGKGRGKEGQQYRARQIENHKQERQDAVEKYGVAAEFKKTQLGETEIRGDSDEEIDCKRKQRAAIVRSMAGQGMFSDILTLPFEIYGDERCQIMMALGKPLIKFLEDHPDQEQAELLRAEAVKALTAGTQSSFSTIQVYAVGSLEELGEQEILAGLIESENWEVAQAAFQSVLDSDQVINKAETARDYFRRIDGVAALTVVRNLFIQMNDPVSFCEVVENDKESDMEYKLFRSVYLETLAMFEGHGAFILEKLAAFKGDKAEDVRASLADTYAKLGEWQLVMELSFDKSWKVLSHIAQSIGKSDLSRQRKRELIAELRAGMNASEVDKYMPTHNLESLYYWMSEAAATTLADADGRIRLPATTNVKHLLPET